MKADFSASEAAQILGVTVATLYSYVSRGLLTPVASPASRKKLYPYEAVMRLAARKEDGKRGGHPAAAAMSWGLPVLETEISHIANGAMYYRGHNVLSLADGCTLEEVACILWDGAQADHFAGDAPAVSGAVREQARALTHGMPVLDRAVSCLPILAQSIPLSHSSCGPGVSRLGASLMRVLAAILLEKEISARPLHIQAASALGADAEQTELIRAALVLLADHELNTSTFTVRCVASTGASLPSALVAGLAALSGERHGGGFAELASWLTASLEAPFASGLPSTGFGHVLYPGGDPRAIYLFDRLAVLAAGDATLEALLALCRETGRRLDMHPDVFLALALMEVAFRWPKGSAQVLLALARAAGWIAHAIEQAGSAALIRPRSRYVGSYRAA